MSRANIRAAAAPRQVGAVLLAALLSWVAPCSGDTFKLNTPRGAPIQVIAERPPGRGPFPVVVLGSGSGYSMKRPILEGVARSLVKSGAAVFRFDWAYFVKDPEKGKQSESRADEVEDMLAVLEHARAQAWVDKTQVFVGGKSLGSIIAWRVLRSDPTIAGAVLLTPVCSRAAEPRLVPETNYPDIASERRPIQWIFGDRDPVCDPRALYQHVARAPTSQRISLLTGDHAFVATGSPEKEPSPSTRRTILLASDVAAEFVATATASAPAGTATR